jgi:hypothetical protein
MTKEQFEKLKGDEEFYAGGGLHAIERIYPTQGIILGYNGFLAVPFRYENCELVVKDELVEYLSGFLGYNLEQRANTIRSIVFKQFINELKFPSLVDYKGYFMNSTKTSTDTYNWFMEETKKLTNKNNEK